MATDLAEIRADSPDPSIIARAASAIRRGDVVAIPTDARYALVCDPLNLHAVGRIYEAKGRETVRAVPLLVADFFMAESLARELPGRFHALAERYWPGPLTMIVNASAKVPLKVTGNTGRLALRQSSAPIPQALLEALGHPLVCTSANLSGQPTIANGIDVFGVLDGKIDLVLDGGLFAGAGPTTVDLTGPGWKLIKEGAISADDIANLLSGRE